MSPGAFITGIAGFAGSHLAEFLLEQGLEVSGLVLPGEGLDNLADCRDRIQLHEGDLLNKDALQSAVTNSKPDFVFHLAALSNVDYSFNSPAQITEVNVLGQLNLLETLKNSGFDPTIIVIGSALEYGTPQSLPITENSVLAPLSPYATSKVSQDFMGYQYFAAYDMKIIRLRPFNHTGPRRPAGYLGSSFAKKISEIEMGFSDNILEVGDPSYERDISDVRDMVRAYWFAANKAQIGDVYNICSQQPVSIETIIDTLLSMSDAEVKIKKEPGLVRPKSPRTIVGDCSKFKQKTAWQPQISLQKTLQDLLNYWRSKIKQDNSN